jgi:hypothetical protein
LSQIFPNISFLIKAEKQKPVKNLDAVNVLHAKEEPEEQEANKNESDYK